MLVSRCEIRTFKINKIQFKPSFTISGLATSFFNDKNRNIARDLAELVVEANQELPEWLEKISADAQRYGTRPSRTKGGRSVHNSNFISANIFEEIEIIRL